MDNPSYNPYQPRRKTVLDEFLEIIKPQDVYISIYNTMNFLEKLAEEAKEEVERERFKKTPLPMY